ncbi:AAA family ATPase [Actinomadura keratinilytica]
MHRAGAALATLGAAAQPGPGAGPRTDGEERHGRGERPGRTVRNTLGTGRGTGRRHRRGRRALRGTRHRRPARLHRRGGHRQDRGARRGRAGRRGRCTVWTARGGETVTSVPFHVVRQLLQPALVSLGPVEAREYLGDWYEIAGPALGIAQPGGRQVDPQGVVDGLVAAVSRLVMLHWPLILIIDDAHWADQESLRWLAAFAQRLDDLPVLLVVAHRDGEATGDSARHLETVGRAARPGTSLATLTAFTPDATAA